MYILPTCMGNLQSDFFLKPVENWPKSLPFQSRPIKS